MVGEMKKRLQRRGARKGFTLVELLIVIIIIGILAGAMMLVAGTSRDAAEASKIISDLRNVKAAALMWLAENPAGWTKEDWKNLEAHPETLNRYLDKPLVAGQHRFKFVYDDGVVIGTQLVTSGEGETATTEEVDVKATVWFLGYDLATGTGYAAVRDGVKNNLANQAGSAGLYGKTTIDMTDANPGYYTFGDPIVYIIVQ